MENRCFSEYEDVLILVNFMRFGGDYDAIQVCFEGRKSKNGIKKRFEEYIRYYPYKVGNWTPYEDYMITLWGNLEPYLNPWDKLAYTFSRRPVDMKNRYMRLLYHPSTIHHTPMSVRSILLFQRGRRVVDVSYYILKNNIEPRMQTIKEFVNILKLFDENQMVQLAEERRRMQTI